MTVIPMKRPATPEPASERAHPYVTLQPAARHAFTALKARVRELESVFSGGATTVAQHARINDLCGAALVELQNVKRFAK